MDELSPEGYGWELQSLIWQILMRPGTVDIPPMKGNHPLFKKLGLDRSTPFNREESALLLVSSIAHLVNSPELPGASMRRVLGSVLRDQFGLSRGRMTEVATVVKDRRAREDVSDDVWDPEDTFSMRGYEEIDARLTWEALWREASPKQQEAMDIYNESEHSGRSIDEVSRDRGRNPVVVRNNFQALKRKLSRKNPKT